MNDYVEDDVLPELELGDTLHRESLTNGHLAGR
jgi:hypothetical protein